MCQMNESQSISPFPRLRSRSTLRFMESLCTFSVPAASPLSLSCLDGTHPDTTTKAGGYANRNAGFIRQPQCGSPACRMNPAFRWRCQDAPTAVGCYGFFDPPCCSLSRETLRWQ
jgi:hypothetical protein